MSQSGTGQPLAPSLRRGLKSARRNQVWSTNSTYLRVQGGFVSLTAVLDWYSRYVRWWEVSTRRETDFCTSALPPALAQARPEIFKTDPGGQCTSKAFTGLLKERKSAIRRDGRGRARDNRFVERPWRRVKYEAVYLSEYEGVPQARTGLDKDFNFYNRERLHPPLN